jgi:hypothetical protein
MPCGSGSSVAFCRKQTLNHRGAKTSDRTASDARSDGPNPTTQRVVVVVHELHCAGHEAAELRERSPSFGRNGG